MKKLAITALALGLISGSIGVYHLSHTEPMRKFYFKHFDYKTKKYVKELREYRDISDMQGIAMGSFAIIAFILALVAVIKSKDTLSWVALAVSILVAIIPLATKTHMFS